MSICPVFNQRCQPQASVALSYPFFPVPSRFDLRARTSAEQENSEVFLRCAGRSPGGCSQARAGAMVEAPEAELCQC